MRKLILSAIVASAMLAGGIAAANAQCFNAAQCAGEMLGAMLGGMQQRNYYRPRRPMCPPYSRLVRDRYGRVGCVRVRQQPVYMWGYRVVPRYVGHPVTLGRPMVYGHPVTMGYPVQ